MGPGGAVPPGPILPKRMSKLLESWEVGNGDGFGLGQQLPAADAGSLVSFGHLHNNHGNVIFAAAVKRGFDQVLAGLIEVLRRFSQHVLNQGVAHHVPEAVRAEQELIARLEIDLEGIDLNNWLLAEAAIDLVTFGVRIDVVWLDDASVNQAGDNRVVFGDFR